MSAHAGEAASGPFVRRYHLIELFLMIGGICVASLGAAFGYNYL